MDRWPLTFLHTSLQAVTHKHLNPSSFLLKTSKGLNETQPRSSFFFVSPNNQRRGNGKLSILKPTRSDRDNRTIHFSLLAPAHQGQGGGRADLLHNNHAERIEPNICKYHCNNTFQFKHKLRNGKNKMSIFTRFKTSNLVTKNSLQMELL